MGKMASRRLYPKARKTTALITTSRPLLASQIMKIVNPSVVISPQNMATGDYFELSSISGTGFTVHFKNSSNASINRNFTYSATGFGKGG